MSEYQIGKDISELIARIDKLEKKFSTIENENVSQKKGHFYLTICNKPDESAKPSIKAKKKFNAKNEPIGVYWEWNTGLDEGDSYIDAPCRLDLDLIEGEIGSLYGDMKYCKNRFNPATLAFEFAIGINESTTLFAIYRVCTMRTGEGGRGTLSPTDVPYYTLADSEAKMDIST